MWLGPVLFVMWIDCVCGCRVLTQGIRYDLDFPSASTEAIGVVFLGPPPTNLDGRYWFYLREYSRFAYCTYDTLDSLLHRWIWINQLQQLVASEWPQVR